jgi:Fe-S cluster assembly scaffold protein SufB
VSGEQKIFSSWGDVTSENFQELVLNDNSNLELYWKINSQNKLKITQKSSSTLKIICLLDSENNFDFDLQIECVEPNTKTEIYFLGKFSGQICTSNLALNHHTENQKSVVIIRNILEQKSNIKTFANIIIGPKSNLTETKMEIKNLILDDTSTILSQPNMRIKNKNVKASHGLADYGLESRQRLFLQARGLNDKQVKAMMIKAFGRVILDHISLVCLQEGK